MYASNIFVFNEEKTRITEGSNYKRTDSKLQNVNGNNNGNNNKIHSRLSVDITANNRAEVLSAIVASFNGKLLSHQRSDVACSLSPFNLSPDLKH